MVTVDTLAAGSHTVKVRACSSPADTLYVRPAAQPNPELLAITVIEFRA